MKMRAPSPQGETLLNGIRTQVALNVVLNYANLPRPTLKWLVKSCAQSH